MAPPGALARAARVGVHVVAPCQSAQAEAKRVFAGFSLAKLSNGGGANDVASAP
jgi:hypothetical protein